MTGHVVNVALPIVINLRATTFAGAGTERTVHWFSVEMSGRGLSFLGGERVNYPTPAKALAAAKRAVREYAKDCRERAVRCLVTLA